MSNDEEGNVFESMSVEELQETVEEMSVQSVSYTHLSCRRRG